MTEIIYLSGKELAAVADIERLCFFEPWSERSLELLLKDGNFGLAAVCDGKVCGYVGVVSVLPEGDITNVAVHPEYRRRGVGEALISALLEECKKRGISGLYLEVRQSNAAARGLYTKMGFAEIGKRKAFYKNPCEDAILMGIKE